MSELWGSVIHGTLLWGFANQVTRLDEAKRFYGLYGVGANLSGIAAGQLSIVLCSNTYHAWVPYGRNAWDQSILFILLTVLCVSVVTVSLFRWTVTTVLSDSRYYDPREAHDERQAQGKISLVDNFLYLIRSRYLIYIAVIVLGYNIVINLTEVVWKHEVKLLYPNPQDYNLYMNRISSILGVLATLSGLVLSGNAIRVLGWTLTALLTPLLLLLTSVAFFSAFLFSPAALGHWTTGVFVLPLVVFFGTLQNCLARTAKYTVFDATKEMAFVPLSADMKINGKAAIDGVGSRLGKSAGSVIHQGLLLVCGTLGASAPWVGLFIVLTLVGWMWAVRALGDQFAQRSRAAG
jgi:AAA family ATP:ADP antiporter